MFIDRSQAATLDLTLGVSGVIGTAAATVNQASTFNIAATAAGLTFTIPAPGQEPGRTDLVTIINTGTFDFDLVSDPVAGGAVPIAGGLSTVLPVPVGAMVQVAYNSVTAGWTREAGPVAPTSGDRLKYVDIVIRTIASSFGLANQLVPLDVDGAPYAARKWRVSEIVYISGNPSSLAPGGWVESGNLSPPTNSSHAIRLEYIGRDAPNGLGGININLRPDFKSTLVSGIHVVYENGFTVSNSYLQADQAPGPNTVALTPVAPFTTCVHIPPGIFYPANTAARLALTGMTEGDEAVQTDTGAHYLWGNGAWSARSTGTTNALVAVANGIRSTVNGVVAQFSPPVGTIADRLGFNAANAIVRAPSGSGSGSKSLAAPVTLAAAANSPATATDILSITFPAAGTYMVAYQASATVAAGGSASAAAAVALYTSANALIANSEVGLGTTLFGVNGNTVSGAGIFPVTVAAGATIKMRGWAIGTTPNYMTFNGSSPSGRCTASWWPV